MERVLKNYLEEGEFKYVSKRTSHTMSQIKGKGNRSTEILLKMLLVRNGIDGFIMHTAELPGKPDFYFKENKLVIFVDGCFWHGCPLCGHVPKTRSDFWAMKFKRNKDRDLKNNLLLEKKGISVIRFWEHQLKNDADTKDILYTITKYFNE